MSFTDLAGALVNLKLVNTAPGVAKLMERQEIQTLWDEPVTLDVLKRRILTTRNVVVWEMHPLAGRMCGYIGIVTTGSPFFFIDPVGEPDFPSIQDAMLQLIPAFFKQTREDFIFFYKRHDANDETAHTLLVEAGFDPVEAPGYSPDLMHSYVLRRETYEIYFEDSAAHDGDDDVGDEDDENAT